MSVTDSPASVPGAAEPAFSGDVPMVAVMRGDYAGSLHRGSVVVMDPEGRILADTGDPRERVFLRSAAKPFQIMPAILSGGVDRFGISDRELAVLCASHNGEPRHLEAVLDVLRKIGLDEGALQCGVHAPLNPKAAAARWRDGVEPTPICNNCSGAHTGMLVACVAAGWPLESYGEPDHPLQREIREILGAFAGIPPQRIELAVDNCAVPTFRIPLDRAAGAFARLASGVGVRPELTVAARRVVAAMTAFPEMVAGEARFDTDLMSATGGAIVAKGGAEGFEGVGLLRRRLGVALKISDGAAPPLGPAMLRVLEALGALDARALDALAGYRHPPVRSMRGEVVGSLQPIVELRMRA